MDLAEKILNGWSITKPQRTFILSLFTTILALRSKVNFRNLSRYSGRSARTFSRQFDQPFDFSRLNRALIDATIPAGHSRLLAFDPCFLLYKAQIEFIFRDAKQFTGLADAQTRQTKRLVFHFNAALTSLNIAKIEQRQAHATDQPMVYSMASVKACYFNALFLQRIFSTFEWDPNWIKNHHTILP